ncbi:hypothetical protein EZ449_07775 [Pedobacter frigidisoli]|uniref:Uncharacterized protein n=1 Tax=Pedobacter frigidisoli TaxID=2530455 RepID=A0A4R0P2K0_9SPHI|nr:hypothetical protein [Pedobacter frigidisoli]TCD10777.1 hypothetical protein EZ449_07775 [Pedobacter frigidisoli]
MKDNTEAVEITTFKLNGYSCKQFIKANKEIDEFLQRQKGFKSRRIFEQGSTIVDMLIWDDVETGTNAMHRLMAELSNSIVHDMIDQSTASWNISTVEHAI